MMLKRGKNKELNKMALDWDKIGGFDRHPKIALQEVGDTADVVFMDEGTEVSAEKLSEAFKAKGIKKIKAKDSIVFVVEQATEKKEVWLGAQNYSNLSELKKIRESNNNTLVGAKVKISRVSKDDPEVASLK